MPKDHTIPPFSQVAVTVTDESVDALLAELDRPRLRQMQAAGLLEVTMVQVTIGLTEPTGNYENFRPEVRAGAVVFPGTDPMLAVQALAESLHPAVERMCAAHKLFRKTWEWFESQSQIVVVEAALQQLARSEQFGADDKRLLLQRGAGVLADLRAQEVEKQAKQTRARAVALRVIQLAQACVETLEQEGTKMSVVEQHQVWQAMLAQVEDMNAAFLAIGKFGLFVAIQRAHPHACAHLTVEQLLEDGPAKLPPPPSSGDIPFTSAEEDDEEEEEDGDGEEDWEDYDVDDEEDEDEDDENDENGDGD